MLHTPVPDASESVTAYYRERGKMGSDSVNEGKTVCQECAARFSPRVGGAIYLSYAVLQYARYACAWTRPQQLSQPAYPNLSKLLCVSDG
jgi:hypothetical protein